MDPYQPQRATRRIAPLDLLVLVFLVGLVASGVYLILKSRSIKSPSAESSITSVVTQIAGQAVEPVDNKKTASDDNPQAIKDELLVTLANKTDANQFGDKIKPIDGLPNTYKLTIDGSGTLADKQAEVAKKPGVENAEPNFLMFTSDQPPGSSKPVDKFANWQWGITRVNARQAWSVTKGGGVTVAVVDTGIRADHKVFQDSIDNSHVVSFVPRGSTSTVNGKTCTNSGSARVDDNGHGTAVASIITAPDSQPGLTMAGVAPHAKIMPIQAQGCGGYGTIEWVAKGIRYAADNGAQVINLSLGSQDKTCGGGGVIESAVKYALSKGVTVVASSGNDKKALVDCPARLSGVIAVGAIDRYNNVVSNNKWGSNYGPELSVVAPGDQIAVACSCMQASGSNSSGNGLFLLKFSGTSASAPFVAGVAALVKSAHPDFTPAQIKDVIQKTAADPGTSNSGKLPNDKYGYGIVNADRAVR
jgi:thermitase